MTQRPTPRRPAPSRSTPAERLCDRTLQSAPPPRERQKPKHGPGRPLHEAPPRRKSAHATGPGRTSLRQRRPTGPRAPWKWSRAPTSTPSGGRRKPVIIARGVRHDYRYSIRSAHDVEPEPGHVRSVKTNTPELNVEDDFGVTPPEPPEAPMKKPSPTPGASRLVIVCYHLPVRVVRDAEKNWTASWGSSIIAKSPSESIADLARDVVGGTIHGGLNRRQLTDQDKDEIQSRPPEDELHPRLQFEQRRRLPQLLQAHPVAVHSTTSRSSTSAAPRGTSARSGTRMRGHRGVPTRP